MVKKLCVNPTCSSHCDVEKDGKEWRFANGFQMTLDKTQMKHFDPEDEYNLCWRCKGLIAFLKTKKMLP